MTQTIFRDHCENQVPHGKLNSEHVLAKCMLTSLEQEAFPGELATLRKQCNQYQFTCNKQPTLPNNPTFSLVIKSDSEHFKKSNTVTLTANSPDLLGDQLLANQLIDVMPTGLVMLDGNGVVVKINQVAKNLLDEPILGEPWFNVIARSFNPQADDWHEVSLKDGRRVKLEIATLGVQPGQLIMITDLTETRLLQDKLAQMQRLSSLGKMVSTLAHQIRTPLSAAILYSENLANDNLAQSAKTKFQAKLNDRLYDLEQQVNDMLLFSKSGKEQVVSAISVSELINDTINAMEALFEKVNAQVNITIPDSNLQVLGNKNALNGAIQNVLHNALQAMSEDGITKPIITVQLYSQDNHVYLSVKDNGPGIPPEVGQKIFQPFFTSSSKGTGLGLAVVKSVVKAHQGEVNLISQPGCGAHFVIKLPLLKKNMDSCPTNEGEA